MASTTHCKPLWKYILGATVYGFFLPLMLDAFQTYYTYIYMAIGIVVGIGFTAAIRFLSQNWQTIQGRNEKLFLSLVLTTAVALMLPFDSMLDKSWYQYRQDGQIEITAYYQFPEGSNSNEVWVTRVYFEDGSEFDLETVDLLPGWQRNGQVLVATLPDNIESQTIVLNTGMHHHIGIEFVSHPWSGYCTIQINPQLRYDINLYDADGNMSGDRYVFKFDEPLSIVGWFLSALTLLLGITAGTVFVFTLFNRNFAWKCMIYGAITVAIYLLSPYIKPAGSVLIFLGGLSCVVLCSIWKEEKHSFLVAKKQGEWPLVFLVSIYASFASFGYRLFLAGNFASFSLDRFSYLLMGNMVLPDHSYFFIDS